MISTESRESMETGSSTTVEAPAASTTGIDNFPDDPNDPWRGVGPVHRHQNITALGEGAEPGEGGDELSRRLWWSHVRKYANRAVHHLKAAWNERGIHHAKEDHSAKGDEVLS